MKKLSDRLKSYSPFFGEYIPDGGNLFSAYINSGSRGSVYRVVSGEKKAAIKVVTTIDPAGFNEIKALISSGRISGTKNIVKYLDIGIIEVPDEEIKDILVLMELHAPLTDIMANGELELSEKEIIKLGMDLCAAVAELKALGLGCPEIKPSRVFYSAGDKCYKLGGYGMEQPRENVCNEQLRAIGLLMYQLANGNGLPFVPENPASADISAAMAFIASGVPLPKPSMNISPRLLDIIEKACAHNIAARYENEEAMLNELSSVVDSAHTIKDKPHGGILELSIAGNNENTNTSIDAFPCVIGRSRKSGVRLGGEYVSARHCMVDLLPNSSFTLNDLESTNGTVLNGTKLTPGKAYPLKKGDAVKLGGYTVTIN